MMLTTLRERIGGNPKMEKPTIWSSGPDLWGRTVEIQDTSIRQAKYGRIRPMDGGSRILKVFGFGG